mmetsp:Transcript_21121/g.33170  ORF Transcript_21121/g.33170 Transcript_21121/m.33170 type:complete len:121 (+) Transcript_21121:239-601(+)
MKEQTPVVQTWLKVAGKGNKGNISIQRTHVRMSIFPESRMMKGGRGGGWSKQTPLASAQLKLSALGIKHNSSNLRNHRTPTRGEMRHHLARLSILALPSKAKQAAVKPSPMTLFQRISRK